MNKHTPGPWEFIDATKDASMKFASKCVIRSGVKQIAAFSWNDNSPFYPTKHESQANACLIAAAPDLLTVARRCEEMLLSYEINHVDGEEVSELLLAMIRIAIAKAEG